MHLGNGFCVVVVIPPRRSENNLVQDLDYRDLCGAILLGGGAG